MVTWGHRNFGGDSSKVQEKLKNVQEIYATQAAFAAILVDGSVVTWGDPGFGGESIRVRDKLRNVQRICATESSFAAILADESVVIWGANGSKVRDPTKKIKQICENTEAFAVVFSDGSVGTSGHQYFGGDNSRVRDKLKNVQKLHATNRAFAALLADGTVATWGDPNSGVTAQESEINLTTSKKSMPQGVHLLPSWQMDLLCRGATPCLLRTAKSGINLRTFSTSVKIKMLLLQ